MRRSVDIIKARIYLAGRKVQRCRDQTLAFALWLTLPKDVKAALQLTGQAAAIGYRLAVILVAGRAGAECRPA